jgi:ribosomal protein S18 acetylase RimI-like enzyme
MKIKTLLTKAGSEAALRPVRFEDTDELLALEKAIIEAGIGVVQGLDDLPGSAKEFRELLVPWVTGNLAGDDGLKLVAVLHNQIVGTGAIERLKPKGVRHVAQLSVGVHPNAQGIGLGRAIMNELIAWASRSDIARIDLATLVDNVRAVKLYKSLGFLIEGIRRDYVQDAEGGLHDDYIMALFLKST